MKKFIITFMIIIIFYILISILRWKYIFNPIEYNPTKYINFYDKIEKMTKNKNLIRNITINYDSHTEIDVLYLINPLSNTTVFICSGNYGNMSYRYHLINFWYSFSSVIIFDYPCFGKSIGKKHNIEFIDKYTKFVWNYCKIYLKINSEKTIILGENIGCYSAIKISDNNTKALILHSPINNINSYLKHKYNNIGINYPSFLFPNKYDLEIELKKINNIPVYLIHSKDDNIIPYSEIENLHKNINKNNISLIHIKGKNNEFMITDEYLYTLGKYCE